MIVISRLSLRGTRWTCWVMIRRCWRMGTGQKMMGLVGVWGMGLYQYLYGGYIAALWVEFGLENRPEGRPCRS